jgi:ABC-2 type transport system ATP-binding protein
MVLSLAGINPRKGFPIVALRVQGRKIIFDSPRKSKEIIMEESIVKVEHLSHRYSVQWAIRDINFEILAHGVYGLLGSNGAGKSTVMNIMCGVLKQTEGNVLVKGIDTRKHPVEAKRHIGFLPQRPPLHVDLTVEEYLVHCANVRLMPGHMVSRAVDDVIERCGIGHFRKRLVRNLSGGYQQRLGIAQAIIHQPAFVVLDEPTNGLDPNQIMEIRYLIKEIAQEHTVLLSTHILSEVQVTCDHIRMIEEGSLVFAGTVEEFDNYITPNSLMLSMISAPGEEELLRVPGVLGVEALGGLRYRIKFADEKDIAERIIETSVARGWRLTEISIEKSSLDSIFAELSKK